MLTWKKRTVSRHSGLKDRNSHVYQAIRAFYRHEHGFCEEIYGHLRNRFSPKRRNPIQGKRSRILEEDAENGIIFYAYAESSSEAHITTKGTKDTKRQKQNYVFSLRDLRVLRGENPFRHIKLEFPR